MQLALEMRYLEAVPVALRATARWPGQVWRLTPLLSNPCVYGRHRHASCLSTSVLLLNAHSHSMSAPSLASGMPCCCIWPPAP